jgi:nucleoside-diphosphate-sugar epimerase
VRIVITGASGNIGTALLLRLGAEQGGHQLVGISRRRPPLAAPYSWAEWHTVDIGGGLARDQLTDVFASADAVIHLAWRLQARDYGRAEMVRTNRDGTGAVAEAARRASVGRLVHMSSIGAYSPAPGLQVDESWPTGGVQTSDYSRDKATAEQTIRRYQDELGVAVVRPAFVLQEAAASEIHRYFLGRLAPRQLFRPGLLGLLPVPSRLAMQVVHADAVADALARIVERGATGAFNVAAEPAITRDSWRATYGRVGPDVRPATLRRAAALSWRLGVHRTEPSWLDLAFALPTLDCARLRGLGWSEQRPGPQVLADFLAALARGSGRPGPLLSRGHQERPGPAHGTVVPEGQS